MPRVVTLLPSATEIVAALGFEDQLVGRSHECDHPPSVTRLPICTAPKFDTEGSSAELDERVRTVLQRALSVYSVNAGTLRRVNPDLIVTQSQCDVCAVSLRDVEDTVAEWLGRRPKIVSLAACSLAGIWEDIERVAEALDVPERGAKLIGHLKFRMAAIAERAGEMGSRPTVACIEWIDPPMAGANWMPELIAMAGGCSLFGEAGAHSPRIAFEDLRASDPELIVLAPCGFKIERTMAELPALFKLPGWRELSAVRNNRVFVVDGNQYFNRPGPRIAESLEILSELIHPQAFRFGHKGGGWRRA